MRMTRATILLSVLLVAICAIAAVMFLQTKPQPSSEDVGQAAGPITVTGTMVCLPHRNQNGPQTDECAFGLLDEAGRYFALADSDPSYRNLSNVSMQTRVEVAGNFTPRADSKYQDIGVIRVSSITSLDASSTPASGGGIAVFHSGVRGRVMLGPTCPVERMPPDPACADKPYATSLSIFRISDPVHAFVTTKSDAEGNFEASLPPGDYSIGAGGNMPPTCPRVSVTIGPDAYATTTISCDTGIR